MTRSQEMLELLSIIDEKSSTKKAAEVLDKIIMFSGEQVENPDASSKTKKFHRDVYKMASGIDDHYKKEKSFSPDQAKWIYNTSQALFNKKK